MNYTDTGAVLSECGTYRYLLWRAWIQGAAPMTFVMLNPSTADASTDDPTIRKCVGFAKHNHYGAIEVVNIFAFRATNPKELLRNGSKIVGPLNEHHIDLAIRRSHKVVVAWGGGVPARFRWHLDEVLATIRRKRDPMCLGATKSGEPRHPLMLSYTTPIDLFDGHQVEI